MDLKNQFLNILFPPRCPGCGCTVSRHGDWCPNCFNRLWQPRLIDGSRRQRQLDGCYCLMQYRGAMRRILQALKYDRAFRYEAACHTVLQRVPWAERLQDVDVVMPVPLAAEKELNRTFNQSTVIFRAWAETRWPWCDGLLRLRETQAQWRLTRAEREANSKKAFAVKETVSVDGRTILLVDDIYTTGATLQSCAAALKCRGAVAVYGLVMASNAK